MAEIKITEDEILDANDYVNICTKEAITRLFAQLCAERVDNPNSTRLQPLPPLYRENRRLRQQMSMGVFAKLYLKKDIKLQTVSIESNGKVEKNAVDCCMETAQFDEWSASHVFNQMERLKASKKEGVRNKVFDILYDFKCFENMLFGAIRDELEMRNDFSDRFTKLINMQSSPQTLEEATRVLNAVQTELNKKEKKDGR